MENLSENRKARKYFPITFTQRSALPCYQNQKTTLQEMNAIEPFL